MHPGWHHGKPDSFVFHKRNSRDKPALYKDINFFLIRKQKWQPLFVKVNHFPYSQGHFGYHKGGGVFILHRFNSFSILKRKKISRCGKRVADFLPDYRFTPLQQVTF